MQNLKAFLDSKIQKKKITMARIILITNRAFPRQFHLFFFFLSLHYISIIYLPTPININHI